MGTIILCRKCSEPVVPTMGGTAFVHQQTPMDDHPVSIPPIEKWDNVAEFCPYAAGVCRKNRCLFERFCINNWRT